MGSPPCCCAKWEEGKERKWNWRKSQWKWKRKRGVVHGLQKGKVLGSGWLITMSLMQSNYQYYSNFSIAKLVMNKLDRI